MEEKFGKQEKESRRENVVGKVVRVFFDGDYKKFRNRVETSFSKGEFVVGSGLFLRSIFEQTRLSTKEFNECQKAIRMEVSAIKKRKKTQEQIEESELSKEGVRKYAERIENRDKIITDDIRRMIRDGAFEKQKKERNYNKYNGLDNPED